MKTITTLMLHSFMGIILLFTISNNIQAQNTSLNLKIFLQGYYTGSGMMAPVWYNQGMTGSATNVDSITVQLCNITPPFSVAASATGMLQTNGTVILEYAPLSGPYYIVVRHRNTLETWSRYAMAFSPGATISYDFTTGSEKAFGKNMIEVEQGVWAVYSCELNDDGNIDLNEYALWETDNNNFESGYFSTDFNGDGNVELNDYSIWETNNNNFISAIKPAGEDIPGVTICDQIWMVRNLDVATYCNGDPIPMVTNENAWRRLTTGAWCWYNNDSATYASTYGRLYNWYAVNDSRGLAPAGWHIPSDAEWATLSTCLGGDAVAGGKMKETGTTHWVSPNKGADNSSGFTFLPGAYRGINGAFSNAIGSRGNLWSSTERNTNSAWYRNLSFNSASADRYLDYKITGFSVRCVKNTIASLITTSSSTITSETALCGGNVTSDGYSTVTARGVCWSTSPNPTTVNNKTTDGNGTGSFTSNITGLIPNTIYHVRAYATNSEGTAYGADSVFTTSDYPPVTICFQTWMPRNLDVATYRNGDTIPQVTDPTEWANLTTGAWCYYNNDAANGPIYGKLYNWYAVNDPRGLAPNGWHITSLDDWNGLYTCPGAMTEFKSHCLPGGRRVDFGSYYNLGEMAWFWTSSPIIFWDTRVGFAIHYNYVEESVTYKYPVEGFSVRCIKDEPLEIFTSTTSNISLHSATSGGTIIGNGGSSITARGVCWSTSANPTIADNKTIDGSGPGIFTSNLTALIPNTTYYVRAYATNSEGTAYGADSTFTTALPDIPEVTICNQIWMQKNLDVATYRNGDPIPQVTDGEQWMSLTTGAWCWYNNDSATYAATYGRMYNWYAVNDPRGLAPAGWHIPSDAEWATLSTCLGGDNVAGAAMKEAGTTHWLPPNAGATNSSGFTALPGGYRVTGGGGFDNIGGNGFWWTSTEVYTNMAWFRYPYTHDTRLWRYSYDKWVGLSVRCVKD